MMNKFSVEGFSSKRSSMDLLISVHFLYLFIL